MSADSELKLPDTTGNLDLNFTWCGTLSDGRDAEMGDMRGSGGGRLVELLCFFHQASVRHFKLSRVFLKLKTILHDLAENFQYFCRKFCLQLSHFRLIRCHWDSIKEVQDELVYA